MARDIPGRKPANEVEVTHLEDDGVTIQSAEEFLEDIEHTLRTQNGDFDEEDFGLEDD